MALVLYDRVQETTATTGTGTITLGGAVAGFQSFAVVGNGNTTFYCIVNGSAWEVGIGTYSTSGPTLARTTVLSNSDGNTSPITLVGASNVFVTYPASKSVNLDASGNVTALGTISSGTWQGSTVGVAYGGTGVTSSSGANSVMLRDANQNVSINRLNQSSTTTTAAAGTTTLTAASTFSQILNGTGGQTFRLPDATTLTNTTTFEFNNNATGTLTIVDNASGAVGTIASGGAAAIALLSNGTVAGTWDVHAYIPENVQWGTNSLALGSTVITGGTWQGGTIASGYGGTGLTTFTAANNALYSTSASALAAGTLPVLAGGTGVTTSTGSGNNVLSTRPTMSVTGAGFTLQDATDNTKQANFNLSGISTGTTNSYLLPNISGSSLASLGALSQTFAGQITFSPTLGSYTFIVGSSAMTGTITLGRSTVSQQTDIQAGATASGSTKTINIGSGGLSGSTTTITIGGTAGTSTTTLNGTVTLANALAVGSGGTGVTTSTGSGSVVLSTSPTLVTPLLGTPTSGTLTNCTGYTTANLSGTVSLTTQVSGTLPVANGGTGVTTSTGSGSVVLSTSPTLTTPNLGTPSALVGTNITGTAAGLSIGGNAATATTATNQSGGTVSATSGAFSSTVTFAGGSQVGSTGDFLARRSSGSTGVYYFGNGTPYLYYDGSNFNFSGGNVYAGTFVGALSGNATTATTAGLANGVNQYPNRTDAAWYQAVWSNAAGGDKNIYSTNNVTINSGSYGAVAFYGSTWTIGGNPSWGLGSNTGLYLPASFACPIMYDANNTGYYSDPASVSNIYRITSTGGMELNGQIFFTASGSNFGNTSSGMWFTEGYGIQAQAAYSLWNFQVISCSVLCGFAGGGGSYGDGNGYFTGGVNQYYSDERLKTKIKNIDSALEKVLSLDGFIYVENEVARSLGYTNKKEQVGVSAQKVQKILPQAVSLAPVDMKGDPETHEIISKSGENYLTVDYSRLVPLLIEAIKEQQTQINDLKTQIFKGK